jgi:hypothetical protein
MIPKYTVEYSAALGKHTQIAHFSTDDPVACEEFVKELLHDGLFIHTIKHEGLELPRTEFDRIIKTAAGMLISERICASLGIKPEEERFRFGYAA